MYHDQKIDNRRQAIQEGVRIDYRDGTSKFFPDAGDVLESLEHLTGPVVAAAPGFYQLRCWFSVDTPPDLDEILHDREPMVAWRIVPDYPEPITLQPGLQGF
jgi:hypothetical protein